MDSLFEMRKCDETGYKSVIAKKHIKPYTVLSEIKYKEILINPTRFTIQVGEKQHLLLKPNLLQYINHSCNPNVFFDLKMMELISLKNIECGEEVVFFYPSTEWKMVEPFKCICGNNNCLKQIKGAFILTSDSITKHMLSDCIKHKYYKILNVRINNS